VAQRDAGNHSQAFSEKERDALHAMIPGDPEAALQLARSYDVKYRRDKSWLPNRGGFYIEIGKNLHDLNAIREGIAGVKSVLALVPEPDKASLLYNLGNGNLALYDEARSSPGFRYDPLDTPLTEAKNFFEFPIIRSSLILIH